MSRNRLLNNLLLRPLSIIYGAVIYVRNKLFDWGLLKQHEFGVPVLCVGNLAVGGTGKTPHTEYIVNALKGDYRIGVLSRGYRRSTKGFVVATKRSTPSDIGDEPFQIYEKFGHEVKVAVCESRVKGITQLLKLDPTINLVVLDDAFQHRYVKPTVSIVLMEWNRPVYNDDLMPLGHLREPAGALLRSDLVVITKCPQEVRPGDARLIYQHLGLFAYQNVFFSRYDYGNLVSVFPDEAHFTPTLDSMGAGDSVLLLSGIANPKPLSRYIKSRGVKLTSMRYPDHHRFTRSDFADIKKKFDAMPGPNRYIITTEKDAVRLEASPYYPHELRGLTFYIPITVEFLPIKMPPGNETFTGEIKRKLRARQNQR